MIRPPQDKSNGRFHPYSGSENKRASDKHLEACPQCGASGKASFYLIPRCRKLGGIAAWHCNQCNKFFPQTEAVANNSNEESLTPEEREEVYYGYGVLADRLNGLLNDPKGKRGMDYLRSRDLSLETINHPLVSKGTRLLRNLREAFPTRSPKRIGELMKVYERVVSSQHAQD